MRAKLDQPAIPVDGKLFGLNIIPLSRAGIEGYTSLTINISTNIEKSLLKTMCEARSPDRYCLLQSGTYTYQLGVKNQFYTKVA